MFDYVRLEDAPVAREPFEFFSVERLISPQALAAANADFPDIDKHGSYPITSVNYGPGFAALVDAIEADRFREAMARKFAIDLRGKPLLITVRGWTRAQDGKIHTDSETKLITVLIYLNQVWDEGGGRLRMLASGEDLEAVAREIVPAEGNMVAFKRSDRSFHGHLPFEGPRRSVQINWLVDQKTYDYEVGRHRFSAGIKRLWPFGGSRAVRH